MKFSKDIKDVIDSVFNSGVLSRDGINYAVRCPVCKDDRAEKKKMVIRLDDGRYHCWVCGTKGPDVGRFISRFRPGFQGNLQKIRFSQSSTTTLEEQEQVTLPEGSVLLAQASLRDPDVLSVKNYLFHRGLTKIDLCRWRIMAVKTGSFRRKAIIPSFDSEGNLNYYVARSINTNDTIRYRNSQVSKENIIFNEIDIDWSQKVFLVEGVFDAIKCPENTIPLLGSSLSNRSYLYKKIVSNQTPCVVAIDPDLKEKAFKLADLLSSSGCEVQVSFAPNGKDWGDLSKEHTKRILSQSECYSRMMRITHKIRGLKSGSLI